MGKIGCGMDGHMNEAKFSEPLPWIGIYIVAASLACAIAMAADLIQGFRYRNCWFPSRYFRVNATTLTIIAVAIKLSVDLNTAMPRRVDQLAKLSSSVLICTVMSNSVSSFGSMENSELYMNLMAMGILVITVIANICIQLGTGVIYSFWREHVIVMFLMLVLLIILSFSALTVPTTKRYMELKYKKKYEMACKESSKGSDKDVDIELRENLMKFWMMAHTCSPQFVIGRSVTSIASGALCLLGAFTLAETILLSHLMHWSFKFCIGESDYKWSTTLVLVTQTLAVGVGTVAPAIRWFTAVNFKCPKLSKSTCKKAFTVERYWIQCFLESKECPLAIRIQRRRWRRLFHGAKNNILDFCIVMQYGIVLTCKGIQYISVYSVAPILQLCHCCRKLKLFKPQNSMSIESESVSQPTTKLDLSRFVLYLEGEDQLVDLMVKRNCDATDHWIRKGENKQPKHLIELLGKSTFDEGFKGVREFDSDLIPSLEGEEPPNCWSLPIVTLTAIAIALPNVDSCLQKQLIHSVHEGITYVKIIEDSLHVKEDLSNIRNAASLVWQGIDLYHKWLDMDLHKQSQQVECTKETLEQLSDAAKHRFVEFKRTQMNLCLIETPAKWPAKVLAANSMYRISQTVLQISQSGNNLVDERLFDALTVMISDILAACLTNLGQVILLKCLCGTIEEWVTRVHHAALLLGKTKRILKLLHHKALPRSSQDELASIEDWRTWHKLQNPLSPFSSTEKSDDDSSSSNDLYLTIEQNV